MSPPRPTATPQSVPAVGTGCSLDKVRFLAWGDYHPADIARKGDGWLGGSKPGGKAFRRHGEAGLTFCRHERGTLHVDGSALAFASYLDGRTQAANIIPPAGVTGRRIEQLLALMLRRAARATEAAHMLDGTVQRAWGWHDANAEGRDGGAPPRNRRLTRWFALSSVEVCADVFTPDCLQVIEAAKFMQGRGRKTDCTTTAYITTDVKFYAKSVQLGDEKGVTIPRNLLRFEVRGRSSEGERWGRLLDALPEGEGAGGVLFYRGVRRRPERRRIDTSALRAFLVDELRRLEGDPVGPDDLTARQRRVFHRLRGDDYSEVAAWWGQRRVKDAKGNDRRAVMRALYWDRVRSMGMASLVDALPSA